MLTLWRLRRVFAINSNVRVREVELFCALRGESDVAGAAKREQVVVLRRSGDQSRGHGPQLSADYLRSSTALGDLSHLPPHYVLPLVDRTARSSRDRAFQDPFAWTFTSTAQVTALKMAGAFSKALKELRFLHCQTSEHSQAVRYEPTCEA